MLRNWGRAMMYQTGFILTPSSDYHHRCMIRQAERAGVRIEAHRVETAVLADGKDCDRRPKVARTFIT